MSLLAEHVERFNTGVRSGDFGPMVEQRGGDRVAAYAWRREPGKRAGELRLTFAGERITKLVVTFD